MIKNFLTNTKALEIREKLSHALMILSSFDQISSERLIEVDTEIHAAHHEMEELLLEDEDERDVT